MALFILHGEDVATFILSLEALQQTRTACPGREDPGF